MNDEQVEGAQGAPTDAPKEAAHKDEAPPEAPKKPEAAQHEKNTVMAILSYIGPLIIASYLLAKDDEFVKFHIKQGLVLLIGEVASWMLAMMIFPLWPLVQIVNIVLFVLAIVGIIRASQGEMKELPFVGKYAKHFKI